MGRSVSPGEMNVVGEWRKRIGKRDPENFIGVEIIHEWESMFGILIFISEAKGSC